MCEQQDKFLQKKKLFFFYVDRLGEKKDTLPLHTGVAGKWLYGISNYSHFAGKNRTPALTFGLRKSYYKVTGPQILPVVVTHSRFFLVVLLQLFSRSLWTLLTWLLLKTTSSAHPHCPPTSPLPPRTKDEISPWLTTG